jgi:hypothetical protein
MVTAGKSLGRLAALGTVEGSTCQIKQAVLLLGVVESGFLWRCR